MADTVNVKTEPTPIQRNKFDVAMELVELYKVMGWFRGSKPEDIQRVFAEFYALARICENSSVDELKTLISEELRSKIAVY